MDRRSCGPLQYLAQQLVTSNESSLALCQPVVAMIANYDRTRWIQSSVRTSVVLKTIVIPYTTTLASPSESSESRRHY